MTSRLSLSQRFVVIIFSTGLLLVIAMVGYQTYTARHALLERTEASSAVIVDALESLVRAHIHKNDLPLLRLELEDIVRHNRMVYVDVFDTAGQPLIQVYNPEHPRGNFKNPHIFSVTDNVLDLSQTIGTAGPSLGHIEVGFWIGALASDIQAIAVNGLWIGLILCVVLTVISWALGRWLSRRLRRFSMELSARMPHDFRHLEFRGGDELGALIQSFNNLQDRLKDAQERRDRAESERQDMTHMLVHDLKGPLGGFAGGLDLLKDSVKAAGDPAQMQTLELMEQATSRLLRMTNSILQLSRLEDPTLKIRQVPVDLVSLIHNRIQEARLTAEELGIELRVLIPTEKVRVRGDAELIGRVIDNLIYNALEHTPHGGRAQIKVHPDSDFVRVEIWDSGPGIPPEERASIFEKFRKGFRVSRGVGLGLAFCKLAVERHGGTIGIEDAPEGGPIFYFTLPAEPHTVLMS
jgi:signal transduction histidine kinase